MPEETTTTDAQAADVNESQVDNAADQSQADNAGETISLEEAKKLRSEAKNLRSRLKEVEGENEKYKTSQLSESEKLQKQFEALRTDNETKTSKLQNLLLERAVEEIGKPLGIRSAKTTSKFIEREALEFDLDKLSVGGLDVEIKRLKAEYPDLFIEGSSDGGKGSGSRAGAKVDMNSIIRGQLANK